MHRPEDNRAIRPSSTIRESSRSFLPEETTKLLDQLGRCRVLPWEAWAHACVAVAAVQAACEAPGEERSFTRLFMKRLNKPYSQPIWEEQYGWDERKGSSCFFRRIVALAVE